MPFMGLGTTELLIILLIAVILLGPSKIPQLARSVGQAIREFRKASSGELEEEEKKKIRSISKREEGEEIDRETLLKLAEKLGVSSENKSEQELIEEIVKKAKEKGLLEEK